MRLCFCYHCKTLSKVPDYEGTYTPEGEPTNDVLLQNWIDRHMHGMSVERHPGGRVFPFEGHDIEVQSGRFDGQKVEGLSHEVEAVRDELLRNHVEIESLRDELSDDANKCFIKHGRPSYPDKKCIDYHDDSKWLGRTVKEDGEKIKTQQGYLCSHCPYESNIKLEIAWKTGRR